MQKGHRRFLVPGATGTGTVQGHGGIGHEWQNDVLLKEGYREHLIELETMSGNRAGALVDRVRVRKPLRAPRMDASSSIRCPRQNFPHLHR